MESTSNLSMESPTSDTPDPFNSHDNDDDDSDTDDDDAIYDGDITSTSNEVRFAVYCRYYQLICFMYSDSGCPRM